MAAEEILRFALFKEVLKPERRKKRKLNSGQADDSDESDEGEEEEEEGEEEQVTREERAKARAKAKRMETPPGPRASVPREANNMPGPEPQTEAAGTTSGDVEMAEPAITANRCARFPILCLPQTRLVPVETERSIRDYL